jgi:integrase
VHRQGSSECYDQSQTRKTAAGISIGRSKKKIAQMPEFEMLPENDVREGFFEHEDFIRLLETLADQNLKDFVHFAYLIRWRKGSIESLQWTDFDITNMLLRLRPEATKDNKPNWILLDGILEEIIVRRWERRVVKRKGGSSFISSYVFHRGDGKNSGTSKRRGRLPVRPRV